jgi:hypothetical protein
VSAGVVWAGVGMNLASNSPDVAALRKGVEEILSDQGYAKRAQLVSAKLAKYDARTEVLSAIDRLVSGVSPVVAASWSAGPMPFLGRRRVLPGGEPTRGSGGRCHASVLVGLPQPYSARSIRIADCSRSG